VRLACDTSVLIPAVLPWHAHHAECLRRAQEASEVPAHVLLECFSVLTRLPAPHRVAPVDAERLVSALPLRAVALPAQEHLRIVQLVAARGIRGGAVYDALVGATAVHHELTLLTRDVRARLTYEIVGTTLAWV